MNRVLPRSKARAVIERDRETIGAAIHIRFYPLVVEEAKGSVLRDIDGNGYIDFNAGAAAGCTGYCHPVVIEAIKRQADRLTHNSFTLHSNETTVRLAEELLRIVPGIGRRKVWFGLSGADANECIYKLAPLSSGRQRIISFMGSYHGMTMGALSMSGHKALTRFMGLPNVVKVPYAYCYRCPFGLEHPECGFRCVEFIEHQVFQTIAPPEDVACLIVEPIQSDSGNVVPPKEFLPRLRELCRKYGILFAVDEVKIGFGRTGKMFGIEHSGVVPDIVSLAKPIASGLPLSACVAPAEMVDSRVASHLATTGGNPICCAAALATIQVIEKEDLCGNAENQGTYLKRRLEEMKSEHDLIGDVRGRGLIIGVELVKNRETKEPAYVEAAKVCYRAWEKGVVVIYVGTHSNVIEITPPLVITREEIDEGLDRFEEAISDVERGKVSDEMVREFKGW